MRTAAVMILLLVASNSWACRCKPMPLAHYFNQAEAVHIGRLVASEEKGVDRLLEFTALTSYKPNLYTTSTQTFLTNNSSAACGVAAQPGSIYVLFAQSSANDTEPAHIDSCSGSRLIISADGQAGSDFIDVPLRFLTQQLLGLSGLDALKAITWPRPDDPLNTSLIGLLDLKTLAHGGPAVLYAKPRLSSPPISVVGQWSDIEYREVSYEMPAAIVFAQSAGWYRLRLTDGRYGWLSPDQAGTYFPYANLLPRRLNYLTPAWNRLVWPEPGAGLPHKVQRKASGSSRGEYPARVLDTRRVADSLWLQVEILTGDECSSNAPRVISSGWIPAYAQEGQPTAWFYSRGC